MPVGAGLGSSAASAVAAVFGLNKLFRAGLDDTDLIEFASQGEVASGGTLHADNVSACYLGGFIQLLGELCRCAVRALLFYFQAAAGKTLKPGVVAVIQTLGDRINFHPHLHFLVTEGGVDEAGIFQRVSSFDDARLAEVFAREVLSFLVGRQLLSAEWAERLLFWRHTGFSVHSRVRVKTKPDAEPVGNCRSHHDRLHIEPIFSRNRS